MCSANNVLLDQQVVARLFGIPDLYSVLAYQSEKLNLFIVQALEALSKGPLSTREEVFQSTTNLQAVVQLLRSDNQHIVIASLKAIRHLCVGPGFIPHYKAQDAVSKIHGCSLISSFMAGSHTKNEPLRSEAALTLSMIALGNPQCQEEIENLPEFTYLRLLRVLATVHPTTNITIATEGDAPNAPNDNARNQSGLRLPAKGAGQSASSMQSKRPQSEDRQSVVSSSSVSHGWSDEVLAEMRFLSARTLAVMCFNNIRLQVLLILSSHILVLHTQSDVPAESKIDAARF